MLQIDGVQMDAGTDGSGTLSLTMQNNGLVAYTSAHTICIHASPPTSAVGATAAWTADKGNPTSAACVRIEALEARKHKSLPMLPVKWDQGQQWASFMLTAVVDGAGSERTETFWLRIRNSVQTLRGCDALCMCPSADFSVLDFSHECRAAVVPASHCAVAKPSHMGSNWASGVLDEYFKYTASQYMRGGKCTVGSTKRDTLLAVYATCARFGAQSPLGFANSEGHTAYVSFPCTAGTTYYIFWNSEYVPGRFSFTISEACGGGECVRAHRMRHLMMLRHRHKQQRSK